MTERMEELCYEVQASPAARPAGLACRKGRRLVHVSLCVTLPIRLERSAVQHSEQSADDRACLEAGLLARNGIVPIAERNAGVRRVRKLIDAVDERLTQCSVIRGGCRPQFPVVLGVCVADVERDPEGVLLRQVVTGLFHEDALRH